MRVLNACIISVACHRRRHCGSCYATTAAGRWTGGDQSSIERIVAVASLRVRADRDRGRLSGSTDTHLAAGGAACRGRSGGSHPAHGGPYVVAGRAVSMGRRRVCVGTASSGGTSSSVVVSSDDRVRCRAAVGCARRDRDLAMVRGTGGPGATVATRHGRAAAGERRVRPDVTSSYTLFARAGDLTAEARVKLTVVSGTGTRTRRQLALSAVVAISVMLSAAVWQVPSFGEPVRQCRSRLIRRRSGYPATW